MQHAAEYETAGRDGQGLRSCDTQAMAASDVALLRRAWDAFARGDIDAATEVLDPQVRWHGAGDERAAPDRRRQRAKKRQPRRAVHKIRESLRVTAAMPVIRPVRHGTRATCRRRTGWRTRRFR